MKHSVYKQTLSTEQTFAFKMSIFMETLKKHVNIQKTEYKIKRTCWAPLDLSVNNNVILNLKPA